MANYYDNNKITYPQLIMEQIKIIQNINSKELRDGQKIVKNMIGEQTIEGEDTRYSFLQSVDVLGSLLYPYFPKLSKDEKIENVATNFYYFCNLYDMELSEALKDKDFEKLVSENFNLDIKKDIKKEIESKKLTNEINIFLLNFKVKEARKTFRELIKLFKDNDFLNGDTFGDTPDVVDSNSMDAIEDLEEEEDE
ncbi:MAG: hypothetical protein M0R17_09385 [Candidatus Omnitrophica bacterium]|jgi:hypothetical protein|nr:hypothetical protein [Candidatus Omnitrophota bacterium]